MDRVTNVSLAAVFLFASGVAAENGPAAPTRSADESIQQALSAELVGDEATRRRCLSEALQADPESAAAHWQSGHLRVGEEWLPIAEAQAKTRNDKRHVAYLPLRRRLAGRIEGEARLARWCETQGLAAQARAHWYQVLQSDPRNKRALKALNIQWREGRPMLDEQVRVQADLEQSEKQTLRQYRQQIRQWRRQLVAEDPDEREEVLRKLHAIPSDEAFLLTGELLLDPTDDETLTISLQCAGMDLLGSMEEARATKLLAAFAAMSPERNVREAALDALRQRPTFRSVPALLSGMVMPLELGVHTIMTEDGVLSRYLLEREGPQGQVFYAQLTAQRRLIGPKNIIGGYSGTLDNRFLPERAAFVPSGCGGLHLTTLPAGYQNVLTSLQPNFIPNPEYVTKRQTSYQTARQRGQALQSQVRQLNRLTELQNQQITEALTRLTGVRQPPFPRNWWEWWQAYVDEQPELLKEALHEGMTFSELFLRPSPMAIATGTPVWTPTGLRKIDDLQVSDLVLAQHTETGELAYQPVLNVSAAERPTLRLELGTESIACTAGQAFWRSGLAWWRTSDLELPHSLHGINGSTLVTDKMEFADAATYQLIVAEFNNFFVGSRGLLVHDATTPQPTRKRVPGLD